MKTLNWFVMIAMLVLLVAMVPKMSQAASFDEAMTAVSASLPLGADVAAMGNIGTLEDFSSNNPAVSSIVSEGNVSGTINYGNFQFEKTRLETISGSLTGKISKVVLQVGFGHGETPLRNLNEFESFQISKNDTVSVQIGGKIVRGMLLEGDELYLGAGYAFTQGVQEGFFITPTPATVLRNEVSLKSDSHTATLGLAYKPIKKITLGAYGSRTWSETQTTLNGWQDPEVSKAFYDVGHIGFSAKVLEGTTVAADYQHISFSDSDTKFDQYFVGIEQYLIKDALALYGGVANGGLTAGLGVYFKHGGVNVSYGHNMLKEANEFLGKSDSYMTSAYFNF
jgi:hypothetical protein